MDMKAVQLHGYGDVDQLRYQDVPDPKPGPGEVLIKVVSTSVNPVDYKIRGGAMKERMPLQFPVILGRDVAGKVTELGPDVQGFKVGDAVLGLVNRSYAEYLVAKAEDLAHAPAGLDLSEAGCLPLVVTTGAELIEQGVQPPEGQIVLVTGAVGSVGRTAVYVAKQHKATVIAGVRASQKQEAQWTEADAIVALDNEAEMESLSPVEAIADTIDGETIGKLLSKWNRAGKLASVLGKPAAAEKAGVDVVTVWAQPDARRLHQLAQDVLSGKFTIPIDRKMPLSEIQEAHRLAEKGAKGKIVLLT
jgi:NADPH:quinone reductase-like Zn-dependent oxidoreductase